MSRTDASPVALDPEALPTIALDPEALPPIALDPEALPPIALDPEALPPIVLDPGTRRHRESLAGGSPRRVLRLTGAGWRALEQLQRGAGAAGAQTALARRLIDAGLAHPRPRKPTEPACALAAVTVVVPVRDRPAELDRCLSALRRDAQVVVVDDGSLDPEAVAAVAARHGARLVVRAACGGPAAARNAALAEVDTDLIAFLDSDCVPERGWLAGLIGHFDDPLVGAVAPRVHAVGGDGAVARYLAARSPLDMGTRESAVVPGGPVSYLPSAALVVRRCALAGGFDERLRYGEDVDLIWRLWDADWRVRYEPAVTVTHHDPERLARVLARRFRYGTAAAPLHRRHPGLLAPAVIPPWPALVAALIVGGRPRAAAVVAGWHSTALGRRLRALGLPGSWGARWFGEATYHAALSCAQYLTMFALPLAPVLALRVRRRWPAPLALLALPALDGFWRRAPRLDPVRWTALWIADDAAYGLGVYWGALRSATAGPLVPATSSQRSTMSARRSKTFVKS